MALATSSYLLRKLQSVGTHSEEEEEEVVVKEREKLMNKGREEGHLKEKKGTERIASGLLFFFQFVSNIRSLARYINDTNDRVIQLWIWLTELVALSCQPSVNFQHTVWVCVGNADDESFVPCMYKRVRTTG